MIRSTYGLDRYVAGESDIVFGTTDTWLLNEPQGVIYCHGSGDTDESVIGWPGQFGMINRLARHATVHVGDLGGQTFGNDTAITRIGQAITYLRAEWGQYGPVVLVGVSMGALGALAYTLANPTEVAAVALVIPGLTLDGAEGGPYEGPIDAAYPPAYDSVTDGPTHSPIQFADDLDPDIPIHMWTSSDDPITLPADADAFVAARPQTGRTNVGALGHDDDPVIAAGPALAQWVLDNRITPAPTASLYGQRAYGSGNYGGAA